MMSLVPTPLRNRQNPGRCEGRPTSATKLEGLTRQEIVPVTGQEYPVDLSTVLRLAEAENPAIALGREAIQEALALQLQARAMLLPSLNGGAMYHVHRGTLQAGDGQIEKVDLQSVYFGGGDWAVGSQTVAIPAVHLFGHVGDAYFAPLVAHQVVNSRAADSRGIENAVLLEVARRYLDLIGSQAALDALRRSEDNILQIVHDTAAFARTGQGRVGDYNRARTDALLLHSREQRAQETVAVASADLARTLHLDPSIRLTTAGSALEPVQLVDRTYPVDELIQIALNARPEAVARAADIAAAEYRLKQEYARPFLPILSVGYSAGEFGGEGTLAGLPFVTSGRSDFDVYAVWTLQNLGFGNAAIQKERRAERDEAVAQRGLVLNQIGREVADAFAQVEARRQQLDLARQRMQTAVRRGTRRGQSHPRRRRLAAGSRQQHQLVGRGAGRIHSSACRIRPGRVRPVCRHRRNAQRGIAGSTENRPDARRQPLDPLARALPPQSSSMAAHLGRRNGQTVT